MRELLKELQAMGQDHRRLQPHPPRTRAVLHEHRHYRGWPNDRARIAAGNLSRT
jgi:hypothetical protein